MPTALTLHSCSHNWRVEIEARSIDLPFYKSIGTQVQIYHRLRTSSMWGRRGETDWDLCAANLIHIQNVYHCSGPEIALCDRQWHNASEAELSEWSLGHPIYFPPGHLPFLPCVLPLEIRQVKSIVEVVIGEQVLTGAVTAEFARAHPRHRPPDPARALSPGAVDAGQLPDAPSSFSWVWFNAKRAARSSKLVARSS